MAIHIDEKITIWDRFSIDEEHKESLLEFLKDNPTSDLSDVLEWADSQGIDGEHSTLLDTGEVMTVEENDGNCTLEITQDAESQLAGECLFNNVAGILE